MLEDREHFTRHGDRRVRSERRRPVVDDDHQRVLTWRHQVDGPLENVHQMTELTVRRLRVLPAGMLFVVSALVGEFYTLP